MHENGITADSSEIFVDPASSFLTCRASRSSCRDHFRSQMSLGPDTYDRKFLLVSQHFGISSREDIFLFRDILTTLDDVRTRWIKRYRWRPPKDFRDILTASHDVQAGVRILMIMSPSWSSVCGHMWPMQCSHQDIIERSKSFVYSSFFNECLRQIVRSMTCLRAVRSAGAVVRAVVNL